MAEPIEIGADYKVRGNIRNESTYTVQIVDKGRIYYRNTKTPRESLSNMPVMKFSSLFEKVTE
jgi:hypothetical protein